MLHRYPIWAAFLATTTSATPLAAVKRASSNGTGTIAQSFRDVPSSPDLNYTPCFNPNFTCANLEVPLDYDNPDVGTTTIAFLKYESPKQPAKGDIIYNPGGPGGSPMEIMLPRIELLTMVLGDAYNIVGMDPRGVNNSGPNLDCFDGKPAIRDYYNGQAYDVNARSSESLDRYFEVSGGFGTWCSETLNQSANYANTPATARDMLRYAEKLAESRGEPIEDAKVNYWGTSYGSTLGVTFAQLFPERVGRFMVDAVANAEDHYFGRYAESILQADKAVQAFFRYCAEAGPKCALFRNGTNSTANDIRQRVDAVLQDLEDNPIAVADPNAGIQFPVVVTHIDLRSQMLLAMYSPTTSWPTLAVGIAQLEENRNATLLALASGKGIMPAAECDGISPEYNTVHSKLLIACNDNNKRAQVTTRESLTALFKETREVSTYVGDVWAAVIIPQCRNLKFAPPANQLLHSKLSPGLSIISATSQTLNY